MIEMLASNGAAGRHQGAVGPCRPISLARCVIVRIVRKRGAFLIRGRKVFDLGRICDALEAIDGRTAEEGRECTHRW